MEKALKGFGLSDNEIATYLTLLKAGSSTANRIAELTELKRSTTYDNLKLLVSKGIVARSIKNNVQHYKAADPQKLVDLLEERAREIKTIVPDLQLLQESMREKTGVSFYEGKRGVFSVLSDVVEQKKDFLFYGSRKMAKKVFHHYPENVALRRAEQGIAVKAVLAQEDRQDKFYEQDMRLVKLTKRRYLKELNSNPTQVFVYADRVAFLNSSANPSGIIIKNKDVVAHCTNIFNILWKLGKP